MHAVRTSTVSADSGESAASGTGGADRYWPIAGTLPSGAMWASGGKRRDVRQRSTHAGRPLELGGAAREVVNGWLGTNASLGLKPFTDVLRLAPERSGAGGSSVSPSASAELKGAVRTPFPFRARSQPGIAGAAKQLHGRHERIVGLQLHGGVHVSARTPSSRGLRACRCLGKATGGGTALVVATDRLRPLAWVRPVCTNGVLCKCRSCPSMPPDR